MYRQMASSFYHDHQQHPHLTYVLFFSTFHFTCFFLITCRWLQVKGMKKIGLTLCLNNKSWWLIVGGSNSYGNNTSYETKKLFRWHWICIIVWSTIWNLCFVWIGWWMQQIRYIVTFLWEANLSKKMMGNGNTWVEEAKVFTYIKECHLKNSLKKS